MNTKISDKVNVCRQIYRQTGLKENSLQSCNEVWGKIAMSQLFHNGNTIDCVTAWLWQIE